MDETVPREAGLRVLVVDDEANMRLLACRSLERLGCEVFEASDGEEALLLADKHFPHLVLLDVVMPRLDGFRVCAKLRERPALAHVPIVMMTALEDLSSVDHSYEVGATDFITKPINWTLLQHRVRFILRASEAFDQLSANQRELADAQRIAHLASWRWLRATDELTGSAELPRILGALPHNHEDFLALVHGPDRSVLRQTRTGALRTQDAYATSYRLTMQNGEIRNVQEHGEPFHDRNGQVVGLVGTLHDVTERVQAEADIRQMTYHDALTGLPNRRALRERLESRLAGGRFQAALIHVEFESLTRVRDALGLEVADTLVAAAGTQLSELAGAAFASSITARITDDAFLVLVPGSANDDEARRIASDWLAHLGRARDALGNNVAAPMRAGIALIPADGKTALQLMQRAQGAASGAVAGQVALFDAGSESEKSERLSIEGQLHRALEGDEFLLEYQPIVDLRSGRVHTLEALIRWESPVFGRVPPGRFVPVAEEIGLIGSIFEWVLDRACRDASAWHRSAPYRPNVAINLSGKQLHESSDIVEITERILKERGFPASCLEYELTEGVLIEASRQLAPTLQALRELGISLSLDDFGTGYSSLSYLTRFPVDTLKIDRSFMTDVPGSQRNESLVSAILAMAHSLSLQVITEGVEEEAQLEFLRRIDCDYMQGYFASRPLSADAIKTLVDRGGILLEPRLQAVG